MSKAAKYNFTIEQGGTFSRILALKQTGGTAFSLAGYSVRGYMRKGYNNSAYIPFTLSIESPTSDGLIDMSLTAVQTATLLPHTYIYDIEIYTSGGYVKRIMQGTITISKEVTK